MDDNTILPLGKLPPELLDRLIARVPTRDPRVVLGPGVGLDCAVLEAGPSLLVLKTEPITFVTDAIGWYALQIAANDIATTGAVPRWYLATLLLPERRTTPALVDEITAQVRAACEELNVIVIGGHTEITHGLDRPIMVGTLIGEVDREKLVTPRGARAGDLILLTKGVPVEATAILAREFPARLAEKFTPDEIAQAQAYLYTPGMSVLRDAQIALAGGRVTAMHDPTEGGLAAALWEMAQASHATFCFDPSAVLVPQLAMRICQFFGLDPLATIASGALLFTAAPESTQDICTALETSGIACMQIGYVEAGPAEVYSVGAQGRALLPRPTRDEITRVYE